MNRTILELGAVLREVREQRQWTLAMAAGFSGMSLGWVWKVENGQGDPKLGDLLRLAAALGADLTELLSASQRRVTDGAGADKLEVEEDEDTRRRTFLAFVAAVGTGQIDIERLTESAVADAAWLRDAEAVSLAIADQRSKVTPGALVPAVRGHLAALEARLPASADLTAGTAYLAGSLLTRSGAQGQAYRCFVLAESLGDNVLRGKARNGWASVYERRGEVGRALRLEEEAVEVLHGAPGRAQAGVLARRAELRARHGDELGALRDLDMAERGMADGEYVWYYLSPEQAVELGAYRGSVLAYLGRHREAAHAYEWTLNRMDPALADWRTRIAADRDRALVAAG